MNKTPRILKKEASDIHTHTHTEQNPLWQKASKTKTKHNKRKENKTRRPKSLNKAICNKKPKMGEQKCICSLSRGSS